MRAIKTSPRMNGEICDLLDNSVHRVSKYAAQRIRELEEGLKELVSASEALRKLVSAAIEYAIFQGPTCDKDCPGDDTCDCEQGKIGKRMDDAIHSAEALIKGSE